MSFPELGVKKHVMAFMAAFAIIAFGAISWTRLGVEETPNVSFPYITVSASLQGADSEIIDNTVTSILVQNLNGIPGLITISGRSRDGSSNVFLEFELNKDVDVAFNEVQVKLNQLLPQLPKDIDTPTIAKASTNSDDFIRMVLFGDRTKEQLTQYAKDNIVPLLANIDGVAQAEINGERSTYVLIKLNAQQMSKRAIGINDVINAFNSSHIQTPGGFLVGESKDYSLKLDFEFRKIEDLKNLVIKKSANSYVRLRDIAEVSYGSDDNRTYSSFIDVKNKNANSEIGNQVSVGILKVSGSNAFAIEKEVQETLRDIIIPGLQPGLQLKIISNDVNYIKNSVNSLQSHLIEGGLITALVVLLILANFRSTLIIAFSIPVSLLGTIVVMYAFGYTFNILTLLALLLLIGVVVDDSIIVLENIYKKLEHGEEPVKSAIIGSNQVVFAVLASTISLVSIFGPVMFMGGIIGKFFQSFAVVVVFGVLISYFVSLYITPMLCARYLKYTESKFIVFRWFENIFLGLENSYKSFLNIIFSFNNIVKVILVVLTFVIGFMVVKIFTVQAEFMPEEDYSNIKISIEAPVSSNIWYTVNKAKEIENIVKNYAEVESIFSRVSKSAVNKATVNVLMVPIPQRDISQKQFIAILKKRLENIVGVKVRISSGVSAGGPGGAKISLIVTASNLDALFKNTTVLLDKYQAADFVETADYNLEVTPRTEMVIDKDLSTILGVSSSEVAKMIGVVVNGSTIGKFNEQGDNNRYDIRLKSDNLNNSYANDIMNLYVSSNNKLYKLNTFVDYNIYLGYTSVYREGLLYSTTIDIEPKEGVDTVMGSNESLKLAKDTLSADFSIKAAGNAKELQKTMMYVFFSFVLSVVLLYMVLASQFNSFIQPFALMMPIPLAIFGAWFSLSITGYSLNIFSMIGMILLVGLVVKNSILLIDLANQLRKEGASILEAITTACPQRLRPILMTSLTVILTMVPAVLSTGEGSQSNASLSVVIIGGMFFSTFLTLVVIPVIYFLIESASEKFISKFKKVT